MIFNNSPVVVELLEEFHLELLGRLLRFRSRRVTARLLLFLSLTSSVLLKLSRSWSTSLSDSNTIRWLSCGLACLEDRGDRTGDMLWRLFEAGKDVLNTAARDGEVGLFV